MPENNPLATELEVLVEDRLYVFKIPTVHDEIKIGMRMRDVRRAAAGEGVDPSGDELDGMTLIFSRACANFEILLKKSSETWPFSPGKGGPVVDSSQFPTDKVSELFNVQMGFNDKLTSFRTGGNPVKPRVDGQVASGQSDPGVVQPV